MQKSKAPKITPREDHCISRANISPNAVKVLYRLKDAGFSAYLVGGGVRDLLVGLHPKDFDVATNATPEEIKKLFRNCILIGRRFRLAHVRFGDEIIEVATFRADHSKAEGEEARSKDGLILRDNVYGTIEEDAVRRDFTINALYYNIADFSVVDYCGGFKDLQKKQLKMIGDPEKRYQEDPVRLLRAIRLAAKLNFTIEPKTENALSKMGYLLHQAAPARLFEEIIKLFLTGYAEKTFELLLKYELFKELFPQSAYLLDHPENRPVKNLFLRAMQNSDRRVKENKSLNPGFIFGVLLWYSFLNECQWLEKPLAAKKTLKDQQHIIMIPNRFKEMIEDMWLLQFKLEKLTQRNVYKLLAHPRFRAAYDFLLLRAEANEPIQHIAQWWLNFYDADEEIRQKLVKKLPKIRRR